MTFSAKPTGKYRWSSNYDTKNPAFGETFAKALASTDENEKITLYKEIQKILTEDAASVYLQDGAKLVAVKKEYTNFLFYPVYVLDLASIKPAE